MKENKNNKKQLCPPSLKRTQKQKSFVIIAFFLSCEDWGAKNAIILQMAQIGCLASFRRKLLFKKQSKSSKKEHPKKCRFMALCQYVLPFLED
ncbi:MAG: hypothetical protein ACRCUY_05660 [Thermoguttaceae bacterium]